MVDAQALGMNPAGAPFSQQGMPGSPAQGDGCRVGAPGSTGQWLKPSHALLSSWQLSTPAPIPHLK